MTSTSRIEQDTWKGRTVIDEHGKRWPDIDDELNWEPTPGAHAPDFAVGLAHPYEQMLEQIMYGKGAASFQAAMEMAIDAMHASLTDEERERGLDGMLQAGLDSGVYEGDIFAELRAERRQAEAAQNHGAEQAA